MSEEQKKKTQTARLKLRKKVDKPSEGAADTGTAPSETQISPPGKPGGVTDPLSLRETNLDKLKRVRPEEQSGPLTLRDTNLEGLKRKSGPVPPGETTMQPPPGAGKKVSGATDTVRLKVVRNKKRELSKVLTASQTIHLRPPAPGKPVSGKPAGAATDGGATVSLKPPAGIATAKPVTPAAGKTLKIRPTEASAEAPPVPLEAKPSKTATATLKIRKRKAAGAGAAGVGQISPALEAISDEKKFTAPLDIRRQRAEAAAGGEETQGATKAAPLLAAKAEMEPEKTIKTRPPAAVKPSTEPLTLQKKAPAEEEAKQTAGDATAQISLPPPPGEPQKRKTSPLQLKKEATPTAEETGPERTQITAPPPPTGKKIQTAPVEKVEKAKEALPEAGGDAGETLKLGAPKLSLKISSKTAPTTAAASGPAEAAGEPEKTQPPLQVPGEDTTTARLTLKVKQPASGATTGKTITLPGLGTQAGVDKGAETQEVASPPDAAATQVQTEAPEAGATVTLEGEPDETADATKGGLKLKAKKQTGEPPAVEAVRKMVGDGKPARVAGSEPGLMLTLASFTTAAALVAVTFFVTYQFLMLCR